MLLLLGYLQDFDDEQYCSGSAKRSIYEYCVALIIAFLLLAGCQGMLTIVMYANWRTGKDEWKRARLEDPLPETIPSPMSSPIPSFHRRTDSLD